MMDRTILKLLERSKKGMTAKQISAKTGIFIGAIYGRLASLRLAGEVTTETISNGKRGRPATLYRRSGR